MCDTKTKPSSYVEKISILGQKITELNTVEINQRVHTYLHLAKGNYSASSPISGLVQSCHFDAVSTYS